MISLQCKNLDDGGIYFTNETDYYAYNLLLFKSLLYVNPYGGIHKQYKNFLRRAEAAVSVYSDDVKYPKSASHYSILSDELNNQFYRMFEKEERFKLDRKFLNISWKVCSTCGIEHSRHSCPKCSNVGTNPMKQTTTILDNVIVTSIFSTPGLITDSYLHGDSIFYSYIEDNQIKRESGFSVATNFKNCKTYIKGKDTFIKSDNLISVVRNKRIITEFNAKSIASNSYTYFYTNNNYMYSSDKRVIGQVYSNNAWFKIGEQVGFGYYKIGRKTIFFIIDIEKKSIDDSFSLPEIEGKVMDREVYFGGNYIFFIINTRIKGKNYLITYFVSKYGELIAYNKELEMDSIFTTVNGIVVSGKKILSTSEEGVKLIEVDNNNFSVKTIFSSTKDLINSDSKLYSNKDGIYVVDSKKISLVKLKGLKENS